jgi:hypothetical protein
LSSPRSALKGDCILLLILARSSLPLKKNELEIGRNFFKISFADPSDDELGRTQSSELPDRQFHVIQYRFFTQAEVACY